MNAEKEVEPSKPQWEILVSQSQINAFIAGQGSGKTHCAGLLSGYLINNFPNVHGFIGANTYIQLSDSTLFRIRKVWREEWGWTEWTKENKAGTYTVDIIPPPHFNTEGHEYDTYHGKICFEWGTVIYKGSLDNFKAHEGKEFAWGILDETKDTKEEAVKEVILGRLREHGLFLMDSNTGTCLLDEKAKGIDWNPLFIFTSPAKVKWLNEWFELDKDAQEITVKIHLIDDFFKKKIENKLVVISSTYHNRKNLPSNYIENQKKNINSGLQDMLIYGNPFSTSGGEYYKSFDRLLHVGGNKYPYRNYDAQSMLHNSMDFNIRPFVTSGQFQMEFIDDLWWVYQISEILARPPDSRTRKCCRMIMDKYGNHRAGALQYGDHTKKAGNTELDEEYENAYDIVHEELEDILSNGWDRVKYVSVAQRQDLMIGILEERFPIRYVIHPDCTETINDFIYTLEDPNGGKLKNKVTDPATGKKYEEHAHCLDMVEYFFCSAFSDYIK